MTTTRRFVKDESGMVMVLAIIMIVLLGVMGAGLLTFADRDLNTVTEQNRGQSAFEVADAGIGVAKRQLTSDCAGNITCIDHYDGFEDADEDFQWSQIDGGVTLDDLDGDGPGGTPDSVNVTIDYRFVKDDFKIISTGTYGESKRKIEAIVKGTGGSFGGEGIGHPLYYTPSSITIEGDPTNQTTLSGISMFTEGDIVIEGFTTTSCGGSKYAGKPPFMTDLEVPTCGVFDVPNTKDALGDWDSRKFTTSPGNWNTIGRVGHDGYEPKCQNETGTKPECERPGFAAEGKICAAPVGSNIGTCDSRSSIADGVYGYDCTTGPVIVEGCSRDAAAGEVSRGNDKTFVEKQQVVDATTGKLTWGPNTPDTLTYPFPRLVPKEGRLKRIAQEQQADGTGGYYYEGCTPPWDTIWNHPEQDENDVIFIDAGSCVDPIEMDFGGNQEAIMVVWCGDLHHTGHTKFSGILMNLIGDGSAFGSTNCEGDTTKGVYRVDDASQMWGWLYAEGGTPERSGIEFGAGTMLHFRAGATWNFLDDAFSGIPPTAFSVQGWRELYE